MDSQRRLVMKVVILAGGVGSRLSEETDVRPKPMVEIGHRPILWHIMKHYAHYGFNDFVLCLGYKGEYIKRYFSESLSLASDMTIDFAKGVVETHETMRDDWRVTLVDTGQHTETGGRLLKIRDYVGDEPFLLTYGDGVADVDIESLVKFHESNGQLATVTAVHPTARFGQLALDGDQVVRFDEKPQMAEGWINGGYFVLEPGIFDFIPGDVDWAKDPLEGLASAGQLNAYKHEGFWQCMDTLRDKIYLQGLWDRGTPPWKLWA
jgi:glucose-1-phosphate cytidylyltransferase